ncbi:MAG: hypothetical protein WD269_06890 [Acidimicrobiia bacterium]
MALTAPTLRMAGRAIPVDLPSVRDPRLHVAGVIIAIHVLGQLGLGFAVSIPQILAAILTAALIEVMITLRQSGRLVWPASAMLTGSGVALIFRVLGTEPGDHWSFDGWHLFAVVAGGSLVTKYLIRHRGSPVFNPSNVGLVAGFLILGSDRVEPLDFWWGPTSPALVLAHLVIIAGGIAITRRLDLLAMAGAFWLALVAGLGALAATGQCMTARWSFEPVCGSRFFWVIATSPEVLVFLFFMITDPRTIPGRRWSRVWFAVGIAVASTLLITPQTTEFGAKVGLLGGLVLMTGLRPLVTSLSKPRDPAAASDRVGAALSPVLAAAMAIAVFFAGSPVGAPAAPVTTAVPTTVDVEVDLSTLPQPSIDPAVGRIDPDLDQAAALDLAGRLAHDLAVEAMAFRVREAEMLTAADFGPRLNEMQQRLRIGVESESIPVSTYTFDSLHLVVALPQGPQGGAVRGFEGEGTVETITYDLDGNETGRRSAPFALTFSMENRGDLWHILHVVPTP